LNPEGVTEIKKMSRKTIFFGKKKSITFGPQKNFANLEKNCNFATAYARNVSGKKSIAILS